MGSLEARRGFADAWDAYSQVAVGDTADKSQVVGPKWVAVYLHQVSQL